MKVSFTTLLACASGWLIFGLALGSLEPDTAGDSDIPLAERQVRTALELRCFAPTELMLFFVRLFGLFIRRNQSWKPCGRVYIYNIHVCRDDARDFALQGDVRSITMICSREIFYRSRKDATSRQLQQAASLLKAAAGVSIAESGKEVADNTLLPSSNTTEIYPGIRVSNSSNTKALKTLSYIYSQGKLIA